MNTILAALLLGHLLYDFHWQGDFIGSMKGKNFFILMVHCLTSTLILAFTLAYFSVYAPWKAVLWFLTHFLADRWKAQLPKTPEWFWALYVDQAIHFTAILVVSAWR